MSALHSHTDTAKPLVFGFYGWRGLSRLIEAVRDYSVAHVIAGGGARLRLRVCSVPSKLCRCLGGAGTPGTGLRSRGARRDRGVPIRGPQKTLCVMSKWWHQLPHPDEHKGESPISLQIMRRSPKEGLEFGRAKWEHSPASILDSGTSLFSYVVMNEVLAFEVLKCLKGVSDHHGIAGDHAG